MGRRSRYSPELRDPALRLVMETEQKHESQWPAICSGGSKVPDEPRSNLLLTP